MINQDALAAAKLAQIFGSELLRVDENTTQQASMTGPAVKLNPKDFLKNVHPHQNNMGLQEKKILEAVQREAEMSYPDFSQPAPQYVAPPQHIINPIGTTAPQQQVQHLPQTQVDPNQMEFSFPPPGSPGFELFESINKNLERIARAIESFDRPSVKKTNKE